MKAHSRLAKVVLQQLLKIQYKIKMFLIQIKKRSNVKYVLFVLILLEVIYNINLDIKLPICGHPFCRTCLNEYLLNMVIKPKLLD